MKILVISNLYAPDRGGGAAIFSDLCEGLAARGHTVTVLTTYPYYPEWRNKSGAPLWRIAREERAGLQVRRYGLFIPRKPAALGQRLGYELSFFLSLGRSLGDTTRYDLTLVYCPLLGAVLFAAVRKYLLGGRLWLNVQDIPADAAAAVGISRRGWFDTLAHKAQAALFRAADELSTISPEMVRRVREVVGAERPVVYFPNWLHASLARLVEASRGQARPARTRPLLVYAGNIGRKQGLKNFCQWAAAERPPFDVSIHGEGSEAAELSAWCAARPGAGLTFGEFLSEEGFVRALRETDFFLITEGGGAGASFIPSKLIPCIAAGTPIIAVCASEGPLGTEVRRHGLGEVFSWAELSRLAPWLQAHTPGSAAYHALQGNCLKRVQFYGREAALATVARRHGLARVAVI